MGPFNSGLRGISCVSHGRGHPHCSFLTEGTGDVYRLDHLPTGQLPDTGTVSLSHPYPGMVSTLEFTPATAIRHLLATEGTTVPATGRGSIDYVIAAYNNFETMQINGSTRQLFGLEFGFSAGRPKAQICAPSGFDAPRFRRPHRQRWVADLRAALPHRPPVQAPSETAEPGPLRTGLRVDPHDQTVTVR